MNQATECKFCGHFYINPCNEETQKTCRNVKLKPKAEKKKASPVRKKK